MGGKTEFFCELCRLQARTRRWRGRRGAGQQCCSSVRSRPPTPWTASVQVGNRVHGVYLNHMQQFVFSPHGALRLKADIGALVECVKAMDLPTLEEKFNATQVQKQEGQRWQAANSSLLVSWA